MKSSQSSLTFILFIFILRQSSCYWQQLYEEFNSQVIHLANTQWNCNSISTQIPQIYSCSQGMDYIKVDHDCNLLKYQISNILPHFQIYLYADIYGYASIDSEEYCKIDIDTTTHNVLNNIQRPDQLKQIGFSKQCPYQNTNFNYQYRETTVFEQQHDMNLMTLSITNNLDSQFQDESYLLRNLQIFINRCYKTCKKCNGQFQNNCTECYTSSIPSYGICDTCQASTTGRFLDIPAGCVFECPTGYSFDEDYVCFANNKLIEYTMCTIPSTNPSNNYQCTMNSLLPSTLHLRYRFTLNFISPLTQKISIKQNDYSISVLESSANIQSEQGTIAVLFQMGNNQYHIEINSPLIAQDQIFSISSDSQEFIVTNFNVEQKTCARFCDICLNEEECKSCQVGKFLFGGSCVDVCPPYTINQNQNCFYSMLEQNSEHTKLLVKEFYDLSTTQQRITELFEIKSGQVDSINFKKGANIFFSYLPDKRILGGPFVWVNAQIQFKLKLSSRRQIINVRFEVLLGDTVLNVQKLEYSINENQVETITLSQNLEIMPNFKDDTWDNNQQTYKQQVDQLVYFDEQYGNQLQIDFFCYGQNSKSFCGIQNLFVATQYECTKYYYFDQYNYITNQNPCIPICGDSVIIGDEECDDGNSIPFDGCFNCKYQCIELCIKCINGQCFDYIIQSKEDTIPTKYQQDFLFLEINRLENLCLFCDVCNYDQCLKCSPGFQLNLVNNQCVLWVFNLSQFFVDANKLFFHFQLLLRLIFFFSI